MMNTDQLSETELKRLQWFEIGEIIHRLDMPRTKALRSLKLRGLANVRPALLTIAHPPTVLRDCHDQHAYRCIEKVLTPYCDWPPDDDDDPATATVAFQKAAFLEWLKGTDLDIDVTDLIEWKRDEMPILRKKGLLVSRPVKETLIDPAVYQAKVLRLVHAPGYLGINKNKFNADVRPHLTELHFGDNSVGFNRNELDSYIDRQTSHKFDNGSHPLGTSTTKRNRTPGLFKRGDIWHIERQIGNTRVRQSLRTSNRRDAETFYTEIVKEVLNSETLGKIPERTLEQAAARYVLENTSKRSLKTDQSRFRVLFSTDPKLIHTPLSLVNNATLARFIEQRQKDGVTNSTINRALALVSSILNQAANKWEPRWLKDAPSIQFLENNSKPVRRPITWSEQPALLTALPDHLSCMAKFICHTGLRDAEVCNLQWAWIIDYPVINTPAIILPAEITKAKQERLIPLNEAARGIIDRRRTAGDAHGLFIINGGHRHSLE